MKRILYYNWVPFDDDENRGGGVTVYQRNLIEKQQSEDVEISFICSGLDYDIFGGKPRYEKYKNIYGEKCKSYKIINSPMMSPAYASFKNIETYLNDEELLKLFIDFIKEKGPFDVIHFNNFEGLSLKVLKIKEYFPKTKIIYSLHNYYSFCPQVNMWKDEECNCKNNNHGKACLTCIPYIPNTSTILNANRLATLLKKHGFNSKTRVFRFAFSHARELKKIYNIFCKMKGSKRGAVQNKQWEDFSSNENAKLYYEFGVKNVDYINKYVDVVLAVSNRVKEIAIKKGIESQKVFTSYIGTKFADRQIKKPIANIESEKINVIFMGYARRDKGFFFLMSALEKLDIEVAKDINLYFAMRLDDDGIKNRIKKLGQKFNNIYFKNGYKHDELENMLSNIHLGIVPVLWEDNLPQVAIELVSHGVAVLASDLGGASELSSNEQFKFKGGSIADLNRKLSAIVNDRQLLKAYWAKSPNLTTMDQHLCELKKYYD